MTELKGETPQEQLEKIEFIKKARELSSRISDIKIAMLSTVNPNGSLDSRPMYTFPIKDDSLIWMFARKSAQKTIEIAQNPHVILNYSDTEKGLYITVNGLATISTDMVKVEELWSDRYKTWFPYGKTDPDLCLLRIEPDKAEYWDSPDLLIAQIISLVKNTLGGKTNEEGDHKEIKF
ncbi:pyridoxamine 5'-phosphate oxidase family protein [Arcticibacter eurypsychrophilus]|uniref:pyridoxamine 5'-phosphate oxidase family protein n=1 Tax=Arcticibacter eurypsychrophilus TaxID=1434752 RepID=UPI0009F70174|nr:pyridoxamine 5'-phosphate oxidase family protein [Arcticibacter eurypsychrophilus]